MPRPTRGWGGPPPPARRPSPIGPTALPTPRRRRLSLIALPLVALATGRAPAQSPAMARGVNYLRQTRQEQVGELALAALALSKSGVPPTDPGLAAMVARVMQQFSSTGYAPQRENGTDIYEAGVTAMLLASLDPAQHRPQLELVAGYLTAMQKPNGSWDYSHRTAGDTSISQYAVLGLWEAENAGARVAPAVWERAARWFMSVQSAAGSWNYHRDEGSRWPETVSMTAAGAGSLLICKRQLAPYRRKVEALSPLLTPMVADDGRDDYRVGLSDSQLNQAISGGVRWIGRNLNPTDPAVIGPSPYYGLYGVERVGALSGDRRLGDVDWYAVGANFIQRTQGADGGWTAQHGPVVNSAWAVLFLGKATEKSVRKIEVKRLGSGTLLGGRGLPDDLSSLTVAQGRVLVRPMNGAVEEMLAVLEDPRAEGGEAALSGLVERYAVEGPKVLIPHVDRFRKLRESPDPGLRKTSLWALARTGDLDQAPELIESLTDPDDEVVATAVFGLKLLSRRLDGEAPGPGASPDEKRRAADQWRAWLAEVRPSEIAGPDPAPGSGTGR